ncbi:MAG: hypothetical protein AABY22_06830, partial [Nanoarchaeota archaeon]
MKHISHPYEVLSPEELIDFIENIFRGNLIATEKVDGINIFLGLNEQNQLTFARNKTEKSFGKASDKFVMTHPAYDAFNAGITAIKTAFTRLAPEELEKFSLTLNGKPNNFINVEIIYGEVPNLISYSKLKNYIVFHTFNGRQETNYDKPKFKTQDVNNNVLLNKLANRLGMITVQSEVVKFFGKPRKTVQEVTIEKSLWEFRGPISVDLSDIKNQLDALLQELRGDINYINLYNHIRGVTKLNKEELANVSKSLTALAGKKVLSVLKSALADPDIETTSGHPGVEGIVMSVQTNALQKHVVKITGDYADLNQKAWSHLRDTIPAIKKQFSGSVLENIFGVKQLITITDASFKKYTNKGLTPLDIVKAFLVERSTKFKHAEHLLDIEDLT